MRREKPSSYSRLYVMRRVDASSNRGPAVMQGPIYDGMDSGTEFAMTIVLI